MAILAPLFFILIALEIYWSKQKQKNIYLPQESFSHIMTAVGQQICNLFYFALTYIPYQYIYKHYAILDWKNYTILQFIFTFITVDFLWYWSHRASHRMNIFIASHVPHHQAEDYNLLSALRQSWTSRLVIFVFFIPMAFLGVKAEVVFASQIVSTFIQFLTHFGLHHYEFKMLDKIFITPATHFAHHGTNAPYLDKNYGGVFSFWDRLFNTYVPLDKNNYPIIGIGDKVNHHDPIEANLNYYKRIFFVVKNTDIWLDKFIIYFRSPEYMEKEMKRLGYQEKNLQVSFGILKSDEIKNLIILSIIQVSMCILTLLLWKEVDWSLRILLSLITMTIIIASAKYLLHLSNATNKKISSKNNKSSTLVEKISV
jgi:alkylglycerol monooxygenase